MKIATFNINGIKARIEALPAWLTAAQPDVVCLQEIKSVDEGFPRGLFEDMGYRVETHGQKSFNGVAILSKLPLEDVTRGLAGDDSDEQARWIEATVIGTLQAAYTDLAYLGPVTRVINERDALLGVSICGFMDHPDLLFAPPILERGARLCRAANRLVAAALGLSLTDA